MEAPDTPPPAEHGLATAHDDQLAQWLQQVVNRDEKALSALYDATCSRVYRLVRQIVKTPACAEEVVEDVYFQVWRQAVRFDPSRGKALTWLLAIAHSRAIDAWRKEGRFEHQTIEDEASTPNTGLWHSEQIGVSDTWQTNNHLNQALLCLQAQPRQLVALAFFKGLSHEEIAEQTALPLGTVKSQIRRALVALKGHLSPKLSADMLPSRMETL